MSRPWEEARWTKHPRYGEMLELETRERALSQEHHQAFERWAAVERQLGAVQDAVYGWSRRVFVCDMCGATPRKASPRKVDVTGWESWMADYETGEMLSRCPACVEAS